MSQGLQNNTFRFMAVRPCQTLSDSSRTSRFLRYFDGVTAKTQFQAGVIGATTWRELKALAAAYVTSASYIRGFRSSALGTLREARNLLENEAASTDLSSLRKALTTIRDANPSWFEENNVDSLKNLLWDSLYAAYVAPTENPHDRAEIMEAIRVLNIVANPDALASEADLVRLLRLVLLVPSVLSALAHGSSTSGGKSSAARAVTDATLGNVNTIRKRIATLLEAEADVQVVHRRALRASTYSSQEVAAALSKSTQNVLRSISKHAASDTVPEMLESLSIEKRRAYRSLKGLGGVTAMRAVSIVKPELSADAFEPIDPVPVPDDEPSTASVRPIGIGDLLIVKDTLRRYEEAEISYVENVLKTESMERIYRRLDQEETTTTLTTEETEETERDLQTTERYELQSETSNTIANESSSSLGVSGSASYGPFLEVEVNAEFSTSSATSEAQSAATSYAMEVTDTAVSKITQSVTEVVTTRLLTEIEETATHGFDNRAGLDHVVGVYRWLQKVYDVQVFNYGKRLMYEFIVPEPAAFFRYAQDLQTETTVGAEDPPDLPAGFTFEDIDEANYAEYAATYGASVSVPPVVLKVIGKAFTQEQLTEGLSYTVKNDSFDAQDGYLAIAVSAAGVRYYDSGTTGQIMRVTVGGAMLKLFEEEESSPDEVWSGALASVDGALPVSIGTYAILSYAITLQVVYQRTTSKYEEWQIATYEAIVAGYNAMKSAYESAVSAAEVTQTVASAGRTSDECRSIESAELKKACLMILTNTDLSGFDSVDVPTGSIPTLDVSEAIEDGAYLQFFEQCFEWDQITYLFYPYFWGSQKRWAENSVLEDDDAIFQSFLRAGAVRVLVPVTPNYEKALLYYQQTGEVWNGGDVPTLDDDLYLSLADELLDSYDIPLDDAVPYSDDVWEAIVPTTLVKLQADATLPTWEE